MDDLDVPRTADLRLRALSADARPAVLGRPTPCAGWDVQELLQHLGHDVVATDLAPPVYERDEPGRRRTAGPTAPMRVPASGSSPAATPWCTPRPRRPPPPRYVPVDEKHPLEPQDPYAPAKVFGAQPCDAAVRRAETSCVTVRPSWVQEGNHERNLGPLVRDAAEPSQRVGPHTDVHDRADGLECTADVVGHEVGYVANPDSAGGHDLVGKARAAYGDAVEVRAPRRPDASGIDSSQAERLLGWRARRSWRDYLAADGRLLVDVPAAPALAPQVGR